MRLATLPPTWQGWIAVLQAALHERLAWRLEPLLLGVVMAKGRRTITSWLRAAGLRTGWEEYYYFVAAVGRACAFLATLLLRLLVRHLRPEGPLVFAIDDTPTKRSGPKVEGAGLHHNPTPGPAGHKLLYGHLWVTLAWIVRHPRWGAIGLPLRACLYIRQVDVPKVRQRGPWPFHTKLVLAKQLVLWTSNVLAFLGRPLWFVTDGGYAKKPFLRVAREQPGVVIVSRLRRDAALCSVPRAVPARKRGRGRPRLYGKQRISLAKRAGQKRGWQQIRCRQYGQEVLKRIKTFEATYRPAGGRIRVVLVDEAQGWLPYFSTDPAMPATTILEQAADRGALEQDHHDLKEVEGTGQQQVRNVWANVGAFHLALWAHCLTELWAWFQPKEVLCDRRDSPWDDVQRRPSHADRRKALQRSCLAEEFSQLQRHRAVASEIRRFVNALIHQAA
jgi:DDE superfamily endonuclease